MSEKCWRWIFEAVQVSKITLIILIMSCMWCVSCMLSIRFNFAYSAWNPSIIIVAMHPWGNNILTVIYRGGLYGGVVLYTNCSFGTWVPGRYRPLFKEGFHALYNYYVTFLWEYNRTFYENNIGTFFKN